MNCVELRSLCIPINTSFMSLYTTLQDDYKAAFKERRVLEKDALNYLLAQLKNKQIDLHRELTDDEVMQTIKKEIKTRKETVDLLTQAGKSEDAETELGRIAVLERYLPETLSEEETKKLVIQAQHDLGIEDVKKERGKLIGHLMKTHGTQLDGSLLNTVINTL